MLAELPFDDVPVLFVEIGGGTPDSYEDLMSRGQFPQYLNHNPRYQVGLGAIPTGVAALTAVALEFLDTPE